MAEEEVLGSTEHSTEPAQDENGSIRPRTTSAFEPRTRPYRVPDDKRCISWKKNCDCGHKFSGKDLYNGKPKSPKNRIEGPPPPCPICGRPRMRCRKAAIKGSTTCMMHGGNGSKPVKKGAIPGRTVMSDDDILTLEEMMQEDDTTLKREFHTLRLYFGKAMEQFENAVDSLDTDNPADVIGEAARLSGMIQALANIVEKRFKVKEIPTEQLYRVQFEDPRVKYLIKESMRDMQIETIKRVVAVLLSSFDPTGELGLVQKVPASFLPYLPSSLSPAMEVPNVATAETE